MQAIETEYNGYRFRSRLEARWAVFFDLLGINYQYELEAFNCFGVPYLPDFYISKYNTYLEIKAVGALKCDSTGEIKKGREEADKYKNANNYITKNGSLFMIFCGSPYDLLIHRVGAFIYTKIENELVDIIEDAKNKDAAEVANKVRFEHGESPDDYIKEFQRTRELIMSLMQPVSREKRIAEAIIGLLFTVPMQETIDITNFDELFKCVIENKNNFAEVEILCDVLATYKVMRKSGLNISNQSLFEYCMRGIERDSANVNIVNKCIKEREYLDTNNVDALKDYIEAYIKEYKKSKQPSLQDLLDERGRKLI